LYELVKLVGDKMNWKDIKDFTIEYAYLEALNNNANWEVLYTIKNPEWDLIRFDILMKIFQQNELLKEEKFNKYIDKQLNKMCWIWMED